MKPAPAALFVVFCSALILRPSEAQTRAVSQNQAKKVPLNGSMVKIGRRVDIREMVESIVLYGADCGDEFGVFVADDVTGDFSSNSFDFKNLTPRAALKKVAQLAGLHLAKIDSDVFVLSKKPLDVNEK